MSIEKKSLHILLTNHHLLSYQGSEVFTFTIADFLIRKGHQVSVYSAYIGPLRKDFEKIGAVITSDLRLLKDQDFDIAHVHHHINAYEIRYYFPHLPIVLLCHGIIFLENPPPLNLKISQYLATSERVRDSMVTKGVEKEKILIFRNMVDSSKFYPHSAINQRPQKALILSNKIDTKSENIIREACKVLKIKTTFVGSHFQQVDYEQMPLLINEADIVFSLGRGVIETMLCGRIPIVFDYEGGDGMVTPSTITENMTCNFSGNLHNQHYTLEELISILNTYDSRHARQLRQMALDYFAADKQIENLIAIYRTHVNREVEKLSSFNHQLLASIVTSIAETRSYTNHYQALIRRPSPLVQSIKRLIQLAKTPFSSTWYNSRE